LQGEADDAVSTAEVAISEARLMSRVARSTTKTMTKYATSPALSRDGRHLGVLALRR
jgi:hypothetical protein